MPVFDQGYRAYEGPRKTRGVRWWPITRACFLATLRWPVFVVLGFGSFFLFYRILMAYAAGTGAALLPMPGLLTRWGFGDGLFYQLLSYEIFPVVLLLAVVGSGQIADDIRSGALQIYFSRPIPPTEGARLLADHLHGARIPRPRDFIARKPQSPGRSDLRRRLLLLDDARQGSPPDLQGSPVGGG